jgi:hypothetical protein
MASKFSAKGAPDRDLIEKLVADGATLREMAEAADRSISTVRYWLRRWKIERVERPGKVDPATAPPIAELRCKHHGLTAFKLEGRGYYRCMRCRQEGVSQWRRRTKRVLVEEAGGQCLLCGYDPLHGGAAVSPSGSGDEAVRALAPGSHPEPRRSEGRGAQVRAPLRQLPRRGRGGLQRLEGGGVESGSRRLPGVDSNHHDLINSQACCHYITGDRGVRIASAANASSSSAARVAPSFCSAQRFSSPARSA